MASVRELQLSVSTGCFSKLKAETQYKSVTIKYQAAVSKHFPFQIPPHLSPPGIFLVFLWVSSVQNPYARVFVPDYSSSFASGFCLSVHFPGFRFFPNMAGKCDTIDIPRREKHSQLAKETTLQLRTVSSVYISEI